MCVLLTMVAFGPQLSSAQDSEAEDASAASTPQNTAPAARKSEQLLPRVDVYLPEGRLDLRLSRLIKNAFFEGQIKYDFVGGDISAFLRYRYYGYRSIYQLSVFDAVEFEGVEELDNDFERVRGLLFLVQWPHDYHHRTFLLAELDQLSSSKEELRFSNARTNTYLRLGFQRGTPNDARSNAIVGETRARIENLFSVHRKIGPYGAGFTGALTYSFDVLGADFNYLKIELEALKRFDFGPSFVIARAHGGTFVDPDRVRSGPDVTLADQFSIPRNELFQLGGRENLKGVDSELRGTDELHATVEVFLPWFREQRRRFLGVDWDNFYWILYGGVGAVGYGSEVFSGDADYLPDVGFGFEASFRLKDYRIFIAGLVADALDDDHGPETHFTIKSYH